MLSQISLPVIIIEMKVGLVRQTGGYLLSAMSMCSDIKQAAYWKWSRTAKRDKLEA